MTAELIRRVDALRRPLELAAKDNFRGVRMIAGLGSALRAACDGIIATSPSDALVTWREILARWEQLDEGQQQVEVARGQRLIARFSRPPAPKLVIAPEKSIAALLPQQQQKPPAPTLTPAPTIDPLAAPTQTLPGIGPAFARRLAEAGLETVEDLLWCLPRRYDDVRDAMPLAKLVGLLDGTRVTFVASVASSRMIFARGRRWAEVRLGNIDLHDPASAVVRWFNVWAGIEKRMPSGSHVTLSGVVRTRGGRLELANPDILAIQLPPSSDGQLELGEAKPLPSILARYPDVAGVPASKLRVACRAACARVGEHADDGVPASVERAASLPALAETLARLHDPSPEITRDELAALNRGDSPWQRRLVFGELFALGVAVALKRRERRADAAVPCAAPPRVKAIIDAALPFALTGAQRRTIGELAADLAKPEPMNRLLQGDVGSGKTAVAFAAAVHVALAGRQSAVMAPTELLAEQHAQTWRQWSARMQQPLRVELLTASTPKAARQSLLALLANNSIDVLIGTHALLSEGVGFGALGLVVIDEQHRFGVAQRAKLRDKGDGQGAPHLLVMTATPIPRTLALTAYGDLDASILDELPPGRTPIITKLATGKRGEAAAYKLVAERAKTGERAYVVCPKVDDTPSASGDEAKKQFKDATTVARELADAMPQLRVGLVHGRLDSAARDRVMRAFKQGELDALVATTVIEVGVDVPEATVMIVHDADRFGLAQLHQLRGRVGRGPSQPNNASQCVLISHGGISEDGRARLDAIAATTDGFRIAEADLALRGPGELCGPRQAGVPRLRFGSLAQHFELLLEARRHAERVLDDDPGLVRPDHAALRDALARRLSQSVYGPESG
ncbi:MAG TPA: ATP-dependent DNA helicase RecG [Kofleriaceae bacterium]|jgi:ATP-dependent DNA helicase RecG|nr:ATP-dependent DNA helicase RecG [Kofleriaceae bacterium]